MKTPQTNRSDRPSNLVNDLLFQKVKMGDISAENELLKNYLPEIEKQVFSFLSRNNISKDHDIKYSLISTAQDELLKAARSYDPSHCVSFVTYAYNYLKSGIIRAYKDYIGISSVKPKEYKYIQKMRKFLINKQKEGNGNPSIEDIADELSLCITDVKYLYAKNQEILEKQKRLGLFSVSNLPKKDIDSVGNPNNDEDGEDGGDEDEEDSYDNIDVEDDNKDENTQPVCWNPISYDDYSLSIEIISQILKADPGKSKSTMDIPAIIKAVIKELPQSDRNILIDLMLHPVLCVKKQDAYKDIADKYKKKVRAIQKIETRFIRNLRDEIQKTYTKQIRNDIAH